MVFYRKYRPQSITDLDSEDVRRKLHSVLIGAAPTFIQVPHAFLFTGPKGLGKTSAARIIAKVINCERLASSLKKEKIKEGKELNAEHYTLKAEIEPCNECEQCLTITSGTNLDILEIDAASNRGIDEIRDLKEKIRLSPVSAKKKIYIIDEVHMLTNEAFNALLKTLEEPPAHAVFILCTTESHKIPATILSRCFHIAFKRATDQELVRAFKRIVKAEELKVTDDTLLKIAKLADGGFRDGTKILEELVALADGKEIKPDLFEKTYQMSSVTMKLDELLIHCEKKDLKSAIGVITQAIDDGVDMLYFQTEFLSVLHGILLSKIGVVSEVMVTSEMSLSEIRTLLELVSKAGSEMKYAVVASLPLELALVSWCEGEVWQSAKSPLRSEASIGQRVDDKVVTVKEGVTVTSLRKEVGNLVKQRAVSGEVKEVALASEKKDPADVSILKFAASGEHSSEWIQSLWKNIISEMKLHNHMIAGVLRSCKPASYDRKTLVIEASSQFHKERLMESKSYEALLSVCEELVGEKIAVTVELRSGSSS